MQRHTGVIISAVKHKGLDSRWASPLAQIYLCCQVCLDDYPPSCAALWQLPRWESSSRSRPEPEGEWQPITHHLVLMFPAQSLMDNVALSIDSWLAAVIIPSCLFVLILIGRLNAMLTHTYIYTGIMTGAYSTLGTPTCSHYKSTNHASALLFI